MSIRNFFNTAISISDNKNIVWLCWMFFCWGIATSMIITLLPLFIVDELGGSAKAFGALEGAVIFLSFLAKLFAGFLIDIFKKKMPMLLTGTLLTVVGKFAFACSFNVFFVFIANAIDRFAKGLRSAPTDTMLAELSIKKGFAFSLRYMMDTSGFLIGSIITSLLLYSSANNFRLIFAIAVIPTLLALSILKYKVKYADNVAITMKEKNKWKIKDIRLMPKEYWNFIIIVTILMFSRFSTGFITLRAKEILPECIGNIPIFMAMYSICGALIAIPIGKLSDKMDKKLILIYGIMALFIANIAGMFASNILSILVIYLGAGIHIGATQGVLSSIVAKSAPKHLIGTAFAIYYGVEGLAVPLANVFAGASSVVALSLGLQSSAGPFIMGTLATFSSIMYIVYLIKKS